MMNLFSKILISLFFISSLCSAQLPTQPTDPNHPGSNNYTFTSKQITLEVDGRRVDVFIPAEAKQRGLKVPVIIFGHGQAIDVLGYELTFKHLAQKGIAVIHPTFDSDFFDQDWRRMASDFNSLSQKTVSQYSDVIDDQKIIYAGHSKGAYIALMAAGAPNLQIKISSLLLFAPAGFDEDYIKKIDPKVVVTLVWSDEDSVIKQSLVAEIFSKLQVEKKQFTTVKSYPQSKAGHFFPLTKSYFFGGQNGSTPYHYFGFWKWILGAAWDLQNNQNATNTYLYGQDTLTTGVGGLNHSVIRSW